MCLVRAALRPQPLKLARLLGSGHGGPDSTTILRLNIMNRGTPRRVMKKQGNQDQNQKSLQEKGAGSCPTYEIPNPLPVDVRSIVDHSRKRSKEIL